MLGNLSHITYNFCFEKFGRKRSLDGNDKVIRAIRNFCNFVISGSYQQEVCPYDLLRSLHFSQIKPVKTQNILLNINQQDTWIISTLHICQNAFLGKITLLYAFYITLLIIRILKKFGFFLQKTLYFVTKVIFEKFYLFIRILHQISLLCQFLRISFFTEFFFVCL